MNLNHLAIFYAIAETGSVSAAAQKLHISQPAVSKQLREFENNLDMTLFDRLPKGMRPTEAGLVLRDYARRIFSAEVEAEHRLAELNDLRAGRLAIGASLTIGNYLLPLLLAKYRQNHPGVAIQLEIANTETIQLRLMSNSLDLGFTEGFVDNAELDARVFATDEIVAIAPPNHPFNRHQALDLATLCQEPLLMRESGSGTRAVIERALQARGIQPEVGMALGSPEAIKQAVAAGAGISLVSRLTVGTELLAGTLKVLPVSDFHLERPLHQLSLLHKTRSRAVSAFLETLAHWNPPSGAVRMKASAPS